MQQGWQHCLTTSLPHCLAISSDQRQLLGAGVHVAFTARNEVLGAIVPQVLQYNTVIPRGAVRSYLHGKMVVCGMLPVACRAAAYPSPTAQGTNLSPDQVGSQVYSTEVTTEVSRHCSKLPQHLTLVVGTVA